MLDAYIIDKIKQEKQVSDTPQPELEIKSNIKIEAPPPQQIKNSEKRGVVIIDFTI